MRSSLFSLATALFIFSSSVFAYPYTVTYPAYTYPSNTKDAFDPNCTDKYDSPKTNSWGPGHGYNSSPEHRYEFYSPESPGPDQHQSYTVPVSPPVSDSPDSESHGPVSGDWQKQILDEHNKYRAEHDAPALQWDSAIAEVAYQHSQTCEFGHRGNKYGQNIAMGMDTAQAVLKAWVTDERSKYSYGSGGFSMDTGHFTQCVWKDTQYLGCGRSKCSQGYYTVCNYQKPGNVQGQYQSNVMPPKGSSQSPPQSPPSSYGYN